ncbi:MAG: GIY-YIG nuclease family protein [Rhodospirillales bacterium]|nr:GIY-YIG nuclease family protein [Rhodospirillales bacterium]
MGAFLYILRCSDGSYYVGTTRDSLEKRMFEHNAGTFGGYTAKRRPVALAFQQEFASIMDAIAMERRVKGWSRAKKEALMRGDFEAIKHLARGRSFDTPASPAAQDEEIFKEPHAEEARRAVSKHGRGN